MKVSFITCTFNNYETLGKTIGVVIEMMSDADEYLLIDGGSDDGTIEVIKSHQNHCDQIRLFTGIKGGVYSALNFGIRYATGDYVGIIHADDYYYLNSYRALTNYMFNGYDIIYGNVVKSGVKGELYRSVPNHGSNLIKSFNVNEVHPSVFVKKSVYDEIGSFDLKFAISGDLEFLLRAFEAGYSFGYVKSDVAFQRYGGISARSRMTTVKENVFIALKFRGQYGLVRIVLRKLVKFMINV